MFNYLQKFDHKTDVNHKLVLESLLKTGLNPNLERQDEPLKYPVFYALKDNENEKVVILGKYGLLPNLQNSFSQTPL